MFPVLRTVAIAIAFSAATAAAQDPAAASPDTTDPATRNVVASYNIKSGRLMLASVANPSPVPMPDGTYTDGSGASIVILDGAITRYQRSSGAIVEISNMRLTRQKLITLTPSTNALMAVSDMTMPTGTYRSPDGSWLKVIAGRPAEFAIAPPTQQ
ncbi:MAG TPA: hypothetical protein VF042_07195 [Gemmatimonadaceae bacterium]